MYKNLVLSVLGLGIVAGLGFLAIESNNKIIKQGDTDTGKPVENPINGFSEFGKVITFKLNDKTAFSDGLNVELKGINDSRCPKDVQCIWAGSLRVLSWLPAENCQNHQKYAWELKIIKA